MLALNKKKRVLWMITGLIVAVPLLLYAYAFINDTPGGLADRRMSRAIGLNGTMHIPLGKTPEDAVQGVRNFSSFQVVHQEPVNGGALLFIKRFYQHDGNDLQVEYVRKTWLGWKWVWGGGYGIGEGLQVKSALNYMSMPKVDNIRTPFPIVFGDVLDPSIKSVTIKIQGKGEYKAKLTGVPSEDMIWYAFLPSSESTPFDIEGFNEEGDLIAHKTITDPNDSGTVDLK